jgi:hypothetical protein
MSYMFDITQTDNFQYQSQYVDTGNITGWDQMKITFKKQLQIKLSLSNKNKKHSGLI